jgi:hypothetical protein
VIIAHGDFIEAMESLRQLREGQNYRVVVVEVEDLYDEFNYGRKSPWAIKGFLKRARSIWQRSPQYVLLVGDASFCNRSFIKLRCHGPSF